MSGKKKLLVRWSLNGYMDFVRGVIWVDQHFGDLCDVVPVISPDALLSKYVNWSNSSLWQGYDDIDADRCHDNFYDPQSGDHLYTYNTIATALNTAADSIYLATILYPDSSRDLSKYRYLFIPTQCIENAVREKIKRVITCAYYVIHVRAGDEYMNNSTKMSEDCIESYRRAIEKIVEANTDTPVVLVCDNEQMRFRLDRYIQSATTPVHSNVGALANEEQVIDLFTDIRLICCAKRVFAISTRLLGTGFSSVPSVVYGVPYQFVHLS